jgi:hypothetical protein
VNVLTKGGDKLAGKKKKISFKNIAKRITGFSLPSGVGLLWIPPASERDIVKRLFLYLEDRRVLYNPFNFEIIDHVIQSVLEMRRYLTEEISKLDSSSELLAHLKAMRAACRKFLDANPVPRFWGFRGVDEISQSLGELRASIGIQVAHLSAKYRVDVDPNLEVILPIPDEE